MFLYKFFNETSSSNKIDVVDLIDDDELHDATIQENILIQNFHQII